jgi:putative addiction module component (TIGR02574 family)
MTLHRALWTRYTWSMLQSQEILEAALELPEKEREMLVDKLSASLHGGFASEEIEQAWATEISRRCADLDSGRAALHDWDEVRDQILADLSARP